jgi:hypothetical protein
MQVAVLVKTLDCRSELPGRVPKALVVTSRGFVDLTAHERQEVQSADELHRKKASMAVQKEFVCANDVRVPHF